MEIRQPLPPYQTVQERIDNVYANKDDFNVSRSCGEEGCNDYLRKALNGTFNKNLTTSECLTIHTSWFGNRSDVLLVSTQDLLESQISLPPTNESLLFMDFSPGFDGPGMYWPCTTSKFDCRKPSSWNKDPTIIENWNVIGYKIDYCLGSELDSEKLCSVKCSLAIMASTLFLSFAIIKTNSFWHSCLRCKFFKNFLHLVYSSSISRESRRALSYSRWCYRIVSCKARPDNTIDVLGKQVLHA